MNWASGNFTIFNPLHSPRTMVICPSQAAMLFIWYISPNTYYFQEQVQCRNATP